LGFAACGCGWQVGGEVTDRSLLPPVRTSADLADHTTIEIR